MNGSSFPTAVAAILAGALYFAGEAGELAFSSADDGDADGTLVTRGQTFEFKFDRPGTYHFYCQPHSDFMAGTVIVS